MTETTAIAWTASSKGKVKSGNIQSEKWNHSTDPSHGPSCVVGPHTPPHTLHVLPCVYCTALLQSQTAPHMGAPPAIMIHAHHHCCLFHGPPAAFTAGSAAAGAGAAGVAAVAAVATGAGMVAAVAVAGVAAVAVAGVAVAAVAGAAAAGARHSGSVKGGMVGDGGVEGTAAPSSMYILRDRSSPACDVSREQEWIHTLCITSITCARSRCERKKD